MSSEDNVRVVVRCRPLSTELEADQDICVDLNSDGRTIRLASREFTFDRIFGLDSTQAQVFRESAQYIVDCVVQGYNGTIFAYGQTGTGKTYTASAILLNSFDHIFDYISKSANDTKFLVRASFYEIYNEEIRDLLCKNNLKPLELKESTQCGVYVKDLSCYVVNSVSDLTKLRQLGEKQRSVAATNMNRESSRSHTIFTITVEMIIGNDSKTSSLRVGKFNLVDLAGSERQSKTGTSGDRLREAAKINLSLTSLSLVIAALTDSKATHIPYRNSKLTRILSDSLGGNSKTLLIACIGPAKMNIDESLSTLRFASNTKHIKNKAIINEDTKDALLRRFQKQIDELKHQLELEGDVDMDNNDTNDANNNNDDKNGESNGKPMIPNEILEKLKSLENKICFGGENLIEKAELQQRLIAESETELQERREKERQLQLTLELRQQEFLRIEETYGTLQEEVMALNKKLKKAFYFLKDAKSELSDTQCDYEKLHEDLLDSIRTANKEIKLTNCLINHYIPDSKLEIIHNSVAYNDLVGEWQLRCIAYTGNNMQQKSIDQSVSQSQTNLDLQNVYLTYNKY
ncbi:kinesin-like protein KIF3A [Oppia nitens]|uniref:kinesin-like protein KIF3A n=1 Tax=Oppia nitens TaxID=1686743 RepID=UPI0023DA2604|nr:kinesin-like protein KIF3A [Oppia nitens]